MKTATIPPVRIEPQFREAMEQALEEGESLTALVEKAVRSEVQRRLEQTEFVRRGMAAIERTKAKGDGVPASVVLSRLQAKLQQAKKAKRA